jgi:hypothetical protein
MKTLFCLLVLAATLAVKAQNTVALQSYAATLGGYANGTSGWTFQPLTNVSVTALGCFDYVVSNDPGPILVGLWAADGTLLTSDAVTTNSLLISQTRFEPINPVLLSTNETYYLGAFSPSGALIINAFGAGNGFGYVNMAPEIQLGMVASSSNFNFSFPGTTQGSTGSAIVPPVLNITLTNNEVLISWSATYTGYALQVNSNFTASNWVATTNSVVNMGGQNQVLLSLPSNNNFYRLKSQ